MTKNISMLIECTCILVTRYLNIYILYLQIVILHVIILFITVSQLLTFSPNIWMHLYMYMYVCIYMYVCVYIHVYTKNMYNVCSFPSIL